MRQPWAPNGLPCSETDASGCAVTQYRYDMQDHLVQVTGAEGNATVYEYSDRDLLTEEKSNVFDLGGPSENALLGTKEGKRGQGTPFP